MRTAMTILLLVPVLVLAAGCGGETPEPNGDGPTKPTGKLGAVSPLDLEGVMDLVEGEREKPLIVSLWANWCDACTDEAPYLAALRETFAGKAEMVGISMDFAENNEGHADLAAAVTAVKGAVKTLEIAYPVYVADPGDQGAGGFYAYLEAENQIPWLVVFDKDGNRLGAHAEFESAQEAATWVAGLIE